MLDSHMKETDADREVRDRLERIDAPSFAEMVAEMDGDGADLMNGAAHPELLARRIVRLIEGARIDVSSEVAAHRAVASVIAAAGIAVAQEVNLGEAGRIDLLAGDVGIEVKVQGGRRDILRQCQRYLAAPEIGALVIATAGAWPKSALVLLREKNRKVFIASLTTGWL